MADRQRLLPLLVLGMVVLTNVDLQAAEMPKVKIVQRDARSTPIAYQIVEWSVDLGKE